MPIFFVKNDDIDKNQGKVRIRGDDAYHIARSLRMAVGEGLTVSDGESKYSCTLESIRDSECVAGIDACLGRTGEPPYSAVVFQALPKGDKLETVIQKSVECGAHSVIPFVSEFCTVKVKDETLLFALIRASFNQRRKTLVNGLTNAAELNFTKEEVQAALEEMGLPATVRGEALTLEQFAELTNLLAK